MCSVCLVNTALGLVPSTAEAWHSGIHPNIHKVKDGEDQTFKVMLGYIVSLKTTWMHETLKNFLKRERGWEVCWDFQTF